MRIAIIGTGYVGLVAGACFANAGNTVVCVDQNENKIRDLKAGIIPIFEPGLENLVKQGVGKGKLLFTTSTQEAVAGAEFVFLAVGTPALSNGEPDLSYLEMASKEVGKSLAGYTIIVNKSTVPIGSHQVVAAWISSHTEHPFDVVSNPEFLKEGSAVTDFLYPDRVVVGTDKTTVFEKMSALYSSLIGHSDLILKLDPVSAEMTKYACNAFLATRISFMNELAHLAEKVGGNIDQIRKGMGTDERIGHHFLYAGVGYGGSCFPKDVRALLSTGSKHGVNLRIIEAAEMANWRQKRYLANLVKAKFGDDLTGMTFGVWGLAFKPDTDDMREAPSLTIIEMLLLSRAKVQVYDPVASHKTKEILGNTVQYCNDPYEAAKGTDAVLLVTEWNEFRQIDFMRVKELVKQAVLFDGRNIYDPAEIKALGFSYTGIGRG